MTYRTEPGTAPDRACFIDHFSPTDTVETVTEVSVAALTTDPDLRDFGRALISLVRYHAARTVSASDLRDANERIS
jgi:hypothetical protein